MSSNYKGNSSSMGTATHTIKIYGSHNDDTTKRSRHKCVYYESATQDCKYLRIGCMGPANALCKHYCEEVVKPRALKVNVPVYHSVRGVGMVVHISTIHFRVKFVSDEKEHTYFIEDIKSVKKGILYL